jgi:hypothetical protein
MQFFSAGAHREHAVAYLLAADIVAGPLPIRLREGNQPVIITRNGCSRPPSTPLDLHLSPLSPSTINHQPMPVFRRSVATAAPDKGGLLSATTRGQSTRPPSRVCTVAIAWPSLSRRSEPAGAGAGASWRGVDRSCIALTQHKLMLQALLALAQRVDTPPDCCHTLTDVQVEPFYKGCLDLSTTDRKHLLDTIHGAEHDAVCDPH